MVLLLQQEVPLMLAVAMEGGRMDLRRGPSLQHALDLIWIAV